MNKTELVDAIAAAVDLPKVTAAKVLDTVIETITSALRKDDPVALLGFGTFSMRLRPARKGRNPRTGETIDIKASKIAVFKAGKGLKDALAHEGKGKK